MQNGDSGQVLLSAIVVQVVFVPPSLALMLRIRLRLCLPIALAPIYLSTLVASSCPDPLLRFMLFSLCFGPKMHCCHVGPSQAMLNPRTISTYAATALASCVLATAAGMRKGSINHSTKRTALMGFGLYLIDKSFIESVHCQIAQVAVARA
jgi:hypothetical protein